MLPRLFGAVSVPATVAGELRHPNSPDAVRAWGGRPAAVARGAPDPAAPAEVLRRLDPGERAALALAQVLGAELLLIDDRAGVAAARERGFRVTGTLACWPTPQPRACSTSPRRWLDSRPPISGFARRCWRPCWRAIAVTAREPHGAGGRSPKPAVMSAAGIIP